MAASGGAGSGTSTTNFPDELIIRHVRDHSCLYDPRETEYKDADRKAAVWREIANNVGMSGKELNFYIHCVLPFPLPFSQIRLVANRPPTFHCNYVKPPVRLSTSGLVFFPYRYVENTRHCVFRWVGRGGRVAHALYSHSTFPSLGNLYFQ